jgi:hypothetical protein
MKTPRSLSPSLSFHLSSSPSSRRSSRYKNMTPHKFNGFLITPTSSRNLSPRNSRNFDGFIASPASSTSTALHYAPEHSPVKVTRKGKNLQHYRGAVVDLCNLTVSVFSQTQGFVSLFKELLKAEQISFKQLPQNHPLHLSTLQLLTSEDARRLVCKFAGGQQL